MTINLTSTLSMPSLSPNSSNKTLEVFGLAFCHLIDLPTGGKDCSTLNPDKCVQCLFHGTYFTGESIHNYHSVALLLYYFIWILTIFLASIGILGNILVILVFQGRRAKRSFEFLLIVLAGVDIFCSISSVFAATGCLAFFGNWLGRGKISLYWYWLSAIGLFGRSCSTFMTVLITIERYLMITFPLRASHWYTPNKTRLMSISILILAIFLNYPRFASLSVKPNNFRDIPSFEPFEYIIQETSEGIFWYVTLDGWTDKIDNWLPLPIILFFNMLSFWKVYQYSKRRKQLNAQQRMNIHAVQMFLPVAIIYFVTNIEPIVNYLIIHFQATVYREMYMLLFLSIAINSAVNLPIYYFRSSAFKKEAIAMVKRFRNDKEKGFADCNTGGGIGMESIEHGHAMSASSGCVLSSEAC